MGILWGFYGDVYASLQVKRSEQVIYKKDFIGNQTLKAEQKNIPLKNGDIVIITHREANNTRFAVTDPALKHDNKGQYTYIVENGKLQNLTTLTAEATTAVNGLFNGSTLKPENTQEQINTAKTIVDRLPNGETKNTLLAKISTAQKALDTAMKEATDAVNVLFNGDTPKSENTQEQIDAAKAKVDRLPNGETKNTLLAKISTAQKALDEAEETAAKLKEATDAVNALFNGDTPKPNNTKAQLDTAREKINALPIKLAARGALQKKYDQAFLALNTYQKTMFTTVYSENTAAAGIIMGKDHDRQDLGIQLAKGAKITIRQTNPKFTGKMTLRLLTNNSKTESSIEFTTNNVTLTAKDLAVPFVYTPYDQANGEKPKLEFSVEGQKLLLPIYTKNSSIETFKDHWNQTKGYALIQGKRFQTFLPEQNRNQTLKVDLNRLIDQYDNDIIGFYNELIGLSDNDPNPLNRSSVRRYFYKADASGVGALYYGGLWAAQTSTSADAWLSDGWGALHETGHGYQGSFMNRVMDVGEVWNNIYGVIYNYKHMGKTAADNNSWLYNYGHKQTLENSLKNTINSQDPKFNSQDGRKKLIILSNIIDKAGNEGLKNFYTNYRKFANETGFDANNYLLPDLITTEMGAPKKYDFSAILNAWGL